MKKYSIKELKELRKAHERGYESATDKISRAYHTGAFNTLNHVLREWNPIEKDASI